MIHVENGEFNIKGRGVDLMAEATQVLCEILNCVGDDDKPFILATIVCVVAQRIYRDYPDIADKCMACLAGGIEDVVTMQIESLAGERTEVSS